MTGPNALATVTATLQNLLSTVVVGGSVTTLSPSVARDGGTGAQINIFLYGLHHNTAFSNSPIPWEIRSGETAHPPLPLVLKYLITAYGANDDDISGQQLMGQAMSVLHDHPLLGKTDIEGITPDSDLQNQVENIRITPGMLTLDDMSKLWTSFQSAEYRLSTGYEVSVVLIQSNRSSKTPLPVLTRGEDDSGITAQADLIPPFPAITEIILASQQASAILGDVLTIDGHHLEGDTVVVHFENPKLAAPIDVTIPAADRTTNQITVQIPNAPANWVIGAYRVSATINSAGEQERTTNALLLPIAPNIVDIDPDNPIARDASNNVTLTIECSPEVLPEQRAALLFGDREVLSQAHPASTDTLSFLIEDAPLGNRFIRLRIDGIDSHVIDHSASPPVFNSDSQVTIV